MKNAMKKLMSVLLVAVLLVSAIPFQASAATAGYVGYRIYVDGTDVSGKVEFVPSDTSGAYVWDIAWHKYIKNQSDTAGYSFESAIAYSGNYATGGESVDSSTYINTGEDVAIYLTYTATTTTTAEKISIVVKVDSSDNVVWTGTKVPANGSYATVQNLLNYCWNSSWDDVYTFDHAWSSEQQKNVSLTGSINAGDTVYIMLTTSSSSSSSNSSSTTSTYNKFPYNVYLRVYMNNDVDTVNRTLDITNGIALDGVVTLAEVRSLLLNYYTANDDNGIQIDGMYLAEGNWVANFVNDTEKYDTITTDDARNYKTVFINVMLTNATAKSSSSSSTADSSNPKTGDTIMAPAAMLGLSAAALAVFFLNKKRLAL